MSIAASTFRSSLAGFAEACERLVHPSVAEPKERARQGRLFGTLLAGPLLAGVAAVQILGARLGVAPTIALVCVLLGLSWLVALSGMLSGNGRRTERAALGLGTCVVAGLAVAGGAVSPLTIMAVALPAEAVMIARTRKAAGRGAIAAAVAVLAGMMLPQAVEPVGITAWHWLVPLIFAATVWARAHGPGQWFSEESREEAARGDALEESIDAVVLRMTMSGDVLHASLRATALFGLPPDMLLGSGFFDRIQTTDRVAYLNALADLREGADARMVELRFRIAVTSGGAPARHAHLAAELMPDRNGDGLLAVLRDNREIVELREALAEASERAAGADLAKSRFLATVSHELRTPLNAIVGFSDVLGNEMFGQFTDPRQREYAELIRDASGHLLAIVNSILDISKIESGTYDVRPETFRFDDAVRLSLSLTAQQAQAKAVSVGIDACDGVGDIRCDRRIVQQVLINLLSNAVKFTPPGGTVTLSARRAHGRLEFEVSDTGIGISAEDLARLGTPFMQVQNDYTRKFEGTGLGLAVVKGLVTLQGGGMTIESAPGAGTSVRIVLPVAEPEQLGTLQQNENDIAHAKSQCELNHEPLRKTA